MRLNTYYFFRGTAAAGMAIGTLAMGLASWRPVSAGEPPRARDLGVPFQGRPGPWNAVTDVPGVQVGHATLIRGHGDLEVGEGPVRTGVTAVLPSGKEFRPVFAAFSKLNGNGEMTGTTWIDDSGYLQEPILLTNTHSVGAAYEAVIAWRAEAGYHDSESPYGWASLPVVAETWDGRLNDIHGFHVKKAHVFEALNGARSGPVPEGNVGGGTGMVCHRFKGGIGTASRIVSDQYRLGVLVQANYGRREDLTIAGAPVGREFPDRMPEIHSLEDRSLGHSIIVIVATDAPFLPHQLKRIADRASLGLARVGGQGHNSSGDLFLAFSTAEAAGEDGEGLVELKMIPNRGIDPFFDATAQATEEAIVNALIAAETMTGINGNTVYSLPRDRLKKILARYGRLEEKTP